MIQLINEATSIARKEHRCSFCGEPIHKGEQYHRATLKYDNIYTWKAHLDCLHISAEICDEGDGISEDDFRTFIQDCSLDYKCTGCPYFKQDDECEKCRTYDYCLPFVKNYFNH